MTDEQDNYIRTAVDRMEQSLASADYRNPETGYARYIDVMSFADYQLAKEFGHDVDGYRLSGKMYKRRDSEDSRFKMALWDMNPPTATPTTTTDGAQTHGCMKTTRCCMTTTTRNSCLSGGIS